MTKNQILKKLENAGFNMKFVVIVKNSNLKICVCSAYQIEKYGCQCAKR